MENVIALYKEGKSLQYISELKGVSLGKVQKIIKNHEDKGFQLYRKRRKQGESYEEFQRRFEQEEHEKLVIELFNHYSTNEIAEMLNQSQWNIWQIVHKHTFDTKNIDKYMKLHCETETDEFKLKERKLFFETYLLDVSMKANGIEDDVAYRNAFLYYQTNIGILAKECKRDILSTFK